MYFHFFWVGWSEKPGSRHKFLYTFFLQDSIFPCFCTNIFITGFLKTFGCVYPRIISCRYLHFLILLLGYSEAQHCNTFMKTYKCVPCKYKLCLAFVVLRLKTMLLKVFLQLKLKVFQPIILFSYLNKTKNTINNKQKSTMVLHRFQCFLKLLQFISNIVDSWVYQYIRDFFGCEFFFFFYQKHRGRSLISLDSKLSYF